MMTYTIKTFNERKNFQPGKSTQKFTKNMYVSK